MADDFRRLIEGMLAHHSNNLRRLSVLKAAGVTMGTTEGDTIDDFIARETTAKKNMEEVLSKLDIAGR